jgi:hypothetical protein
MNKRQKELAYSECKTFYHWMEDAPPSTPSNVEFGLVLRCARCGTIRHVELDSITGHVMPGQSWYDYPPDYKEIGVKLTRQELRLAKAEVRFSRSQRRLRSVS